MEIDIASYVIGIIVGGLIASKIASKEKLPKETPRKPLYTAKEVYGKFEELEEINNTNSHDLDKLKDELKDELSKIN